jgi:sortase B
MFHRRNTALSRQHNGSLKKCTDTNFRKSQQGYYPDQTPPVHRPELEGKCVCAGDLPSTAKKSRKYALLFLLGILLSLIGAWILIQPMITRANRQKAEFELQTIYYEAVAKEAASTKSAASEETLPSPKPDFILDPNLRTFVTPKPWTTYVTRDRFFTLLKINKDAIGWLTIKDVLDLPVVQRDNSYYLTHDFRGLKSISGALFLDENFDIYPPNENLLIHGHNMRDGSMFGQLQKYRNRPFYTKHWLVTFETRHENGDYAVFAAFSVSNDTSDPFYFQYVYNHFETDIQFEAYIASVKEKSVFRCGLDVLPTDSLLTLSTCSGGSDNYFVVIARRIREDESLSSVKATCMHSTFH